MPKLKGNEEKACLTRQRLPKLLLLLLLLIVPLIEGNKRFVERGGSMGELLLETVLPFMQQETWLYNWLPCYVEAFTTVSVGNPEAALITHCLPFFNEGNTLQEAKHDIKGYFEQDENSYLKEEPVEKEDKKESVALEALKDPYYVYKNMMTADAKMEFDVDMLEEWNFYELANESLKVKMTSKAPEILIFHTHAREAYSDGTTVVDVGEALKTKLEAKGFHVLHVTDAFYQDDTLNVTGCYEIMEEGIEKVLKAYPSIQVCIDIHRDGVNDNVHLVTEIDGKQTAKVMFVNGLCMNRNIDGEVVHKANLQNPYLAENLAFSVQAQLEAYAAYPSLIRKIFCKEYRYSTHMKPLSLLVEIGANTNNGEEALNAVGPLSDILTKVLQKD